MLKLFLRREWDIWTGFVWLRIRNTGELITRAHTILGIS
jgi:hypothetical protein